MSAEAPERRDKKHEAGVARDSGHLLLPGRRGAPYIGDNVIAYQQRGRLALQGQKAQTRNYPGGHQLFMGTFAIFLGGKNDSFQQYAAISPLSSM